MSGGFFRGTSADQDTRFSNKQAKLMKSQKFAPELEHLVDVRKVKMDVIRPWIAARATELIGFEDEVLINFIYGLLDGTEVNGKEIQISLTGFMEKNTGKFMKELWALLLSAEKNASGVPQQFLDAKEEETRKKKAESDRITNEIQLKKEKERREREEERLKKMDSVAAKVATAALDTTRSTLHSGDEKETGERNGVRGRSRVSGSPHSVSRSPSFIRGSPSRSISKSFSNSRSYSGDRHRSRSLSKSPKSGRHSSSLERMNPSPMRRSITPRRRRSLSPSRRRSSYNRRRSGTRSPYRSPSPIRRRFRSPYRRQSPSPIRRRSRRSPSPIRRRHSPSPYRRYSRSPLRPRSRSPYRRRSPSPLQGRSPSPYRRHSPSPVRRRSPMRRRYQRSPSTPRRRSPSPMRRRLPAPIRRRSPSPMRRRSPIHGRRRSPVPSRRRSPSPDESGSRSPIRHSSPSPRMRKSPKFQRLPVLSREGIRSAQRDPKELSISRDKSPLLSASPEGSPTRLRSPVVERKRIPSEDIRSSSSPHESPAQQTQKRVTHDGLPSPPRRPREHKPRYENPERRKEERESNHARMDGENRPKSEQRRSFRSPTASKRKSSPGKVQYIKDYPEKLAVRGADKSQSIELELRSEDQEIKSARGVHPETPDRKKDFLQSENHQATYSKEGKKSDEKKRSQTNNIKDNNEPRKPEILSRKVENVCINDRQSTYDSESEEGDKHRDDNKGKRKHKRSERQQVASDDDDSYDSELDERKETKRRKEEKKLKKEEKRRRRAERRRKREERRAEKLKLKNEKDDYVSDGDHVSKRDSHQSDHEEMVSEQQKLEIELRKKALESLKAKKGIRH